MLGICAITFDITDQQKKIWWQSLLSSKHFSIIIVVVVPGNAQTAGSLPDHVGTISGALELSKP